MSSPAMSLDKNDLIHSLKVLGFSLGSCVIAFLIMLLSDVHVDPKYAAIVPLINSVLVLINRFFTDRTSQAEGAQKGGAA